MDVYLIPVGPERYELYCEEEAELADVAAEDPSGLFAGMAFHFHTWLARIEHERRRQSTQASASDGVERPLMRRVRDRALSWVAEKIAEPVPPIGVRLAFGVVNRAGRPRGAPLQQLAAGRRAISSPSPLRA